MSVAGKSAAWALLLRIFLFGVAPMRAVYLPIVIFVAIATMTGGNLAALTQSNVKRLFAYSSIAHVGYMLLGLIAGSAQFTSPNGIRGILVYLLVYTFMNLGVFAVIASLRRRDIIGDEVDDLNGLFFKAPTEAVLMLVFLLSLAGIPPLAGFYGKYFIFLALIETGHYALATLAVVYVAVSAYYYLRVANAMFMRAAAQTPAISISWGMGTALGVTGLATVVIGIYPEPFLNMVNWSMHVAQNPTVAQLLR
jgi:NADH-quinone oxidoreductase subunit N